MVVGVSRYPFRVGRVGLGGVGWGVWVGGGGEEPNGGGGGWLDWKGGGGGEGVGGEGGGGGGGGMKIGGCLPPVSKQGADALFTRKTASSIKAVSIWQT